MKNTLFTLSVILALLIVPQMSYAEINLTAQNVMNQASAFIKKGDYQSAYQLLAPLENELAGELEYDLLLGTSAVESNHHTQGIFALERVLVINPDHKEARLKIAKAHFLAGEVQNSKSEFNRVLLQSPSSETARAIEKYLAAIDKAMGLTTTFTGFLEAGLGWDSNVNSATSANSVSVPLFGGQNFDLSEQGRKSSAFLNLTGGAGFRVPATPSVSYIGNLQFAKRLNQHNQEFETGAIDLNVGLQYRDNQDVYSLALQNNHFYLDDSRFRNSYGATAQWQHSFDLKTQTSLYAQYAKLEYDDNAVRDADRVILGANYAHAFDGEMSPIAYLGAYLGQEDANKTGTKFLDQDIYGLKAGGQLMVAPSWLAYFSAGYELREHQAEDTSFLKKRHDNQYDITLGVNYIPARYWSIKPQISLIKNDSNIELYEYDRATMSVNIRREFDW